MNLVKRQVPIILLVGTCLFLITLGYYSKEKFTYVQTIFVSIEIILFSLVAILVFWMRSLEIKTNDPFISVNSLYLSVISKFIVLIGLMLSYYLLYGKLTNKFFAFWMFSVFLVYQVYITGVSLKQNK